MPVLEPRSVDGEVLWDLFRRFVAVDTAVRPGETSVAPHDARVTEFAASVAPVLERCGARVEVDRGNNLVARFGPDTPGALLLVSYGITHHGNRMPDPLVPRRRASDGDVWWDGLGAGQGKGGLAAVCCALDHLRMEGTDLNGRVAVAVSSEGSSTNESARALFGGLEERPYGAVLTIGTGNRIALGHRGRVDVVVRVEGKATHSSTPEAGTNPIPIVGAVQQRLDSFVLEPRAHPSLGPRALVAYRLACSPIAPHTIPEQCELVLDRRFLPGEDAGDAVAEIAEHLHDLPVTVAQGPTMLPALVTEDAAVVRSLQRSANAALGHQLETFFPRYTFDAGYGCSIGVPTVMCGPSSGDLDTGGVLGVDAVSERQLREAVAVYTEAIRTGFQN